MEWKNVNYILNENIRIYKSSYKKPIANTKLNDEKLNAFPQDLEEGKNVYCHHFRSTVQ